MWLFAPISPIRIPFLWFLRPKMSEFTAAFPAICGIFGDFFPTFFLFCFTEASLEQLAARKSHNLIHGVEFPLLLSWWWYRKIILLASFGLFLWIQQSVWLGLKPTAHTVWRNREVIYLSTVIVLTYITFHEDPAVHATVLHQHVYTPTFLPFSTNVLFSWALAHHQVRSAWIAHSFNVIREEKSKDVIDWSKLRESCRDWLELWHRP